MINKVQFFVIVSFTIILSSPFAFANRTTETIFYHDKNGKPKRKVVTTIDNTPAPLESLPCRWVTKLSHDRNGKPVRKQVKICNYDR